MKVGANVDSVKRVRLARVYRVAAAPAALIIARRATRLTGPQERLSVALQQLRGGVPLNWGQVESDPELQTLAIVYPLAQQWRSQTSGDLPGELVEAIIQDLAPRLPRRQVEAVRATPTSIAGYSASVAVGTQAEESMPDLVSRLPGRIAAVLAVVALAALAVWTYGIFTRPGPLRFTWIEVQQNGTVVAERHAPAGWKAPVCTELSPGDPAARRTFTRMDTIRATELNAGFTVALIPPSTTVAGTVYKAQYLSSSIATCSGATAMPGDLGQEVLVSYALRQNDTDVAPLALFEEVRQSVTFEAGKGKWHEVRVPSGHGIYWRGDSYTDIGGTQWTGDTGVLIIELGDRITTLIGKPNTGGTERVLLALAAGMSPELNTQQGTPTSGVPAYTTGLQEPMKR
ncbi:MAG: hypothetical protein M3014_10395 [Chloroflexota bacterium]|nr:hypothetical protein [Chloroflexota bacterium]